MAKFQYAGQPADYPTLGFSVTANGAILDGTLSTPAVTVAPDARWSTYGGGSAETGITRYGSGVSTPITEPAEGSVLAYNATTNTYEPVLPGSAELASAENVTGTTTALSTAGGFGTGVNLPQCNIVVPASSRPVIIHYGCTFQTTTLGVGIFLLGVYETTGGGNVNKDFVKRAIPTSVTAGPADVSAERSWRLGATTVERTFKLVALLWTNAGDDAAGAVLNNAANSSFIRAVAQ